MKPLSADDIVRVWEQGANQGGSERALTVLAQALPEYSRRELEQLPIGRRDQYLMQVRAMTFDDNLNGFAECPHCRERLEFDMSVEQLLVDTPATTESDVELVTDDLVFHVRPINSADMIAAARLNQPDQARKFLTRACMVDMRNSDGTPSDKELPSDVVERLSEMLAEIDPLAEILIDLRCPNCEHSWRMLFDIASFFWTEISVQARRLLREVAVLARAYGWRESDILAMSPVRREFYLDLVS